MSRQIGTSLDTVLNPGGVGWYIKRGTIDFLELAYQEGISQSIITQIGLSYSATAVYILYGCQLSTGGGNTTISAGAIFFNGEIFICAGQTFTTPTGGNVVVANLGSVSWQPTDAVGNYYADPQEFVGAGNSTIHILGTAVFAGAASGLSTLETSVGGTVVYAGVAANYSNIIGYGKWVQAPSLTATCSAGGTITLDTVNYNKYRIDGNTITWTIDCNVTIGGTPPIGLFFQMSTSIGYNFQNLFGVQMNGVYQLYTPMITTIEGSSGQLQVLCNLVSNAAFSTGSTQRINLTIIAEIA